MSYLMIRMVSGIGALVSTTVLRKARNVRDLHLRIYGTAFYFRSTGCLSFWCPCLVHAQNRRRLDYLTVNGVPDPERNQVTAEGGLFYGFLEVACDLGFILQVGRLVFSSSRSIS